MRDKLTSLALKFGLVLLLIDIIMLFIVDYGTASWVITWMGFGILVIFDGILIFIIRWKIRKENKDENKND